MPRGSTARKRRSARRQAHSHRRDVRGVGKAPDATETLLAAASGATDLPLSDRDTSWDASAAEKSLDPGQYADAHFWRDPDGDPKTLSAYKLPFATASGGTLTAVWAGVTAAAQRLSQTDIPSGDVSGVQSKIAAYYTAARKKYNDPEIQPPWEASSASEEEEASAEIDALAAVEEWAAHEEPGLGEAIADASADLPGGEELVATVAAALEGLDAPTVVDQPTPRTRASLKRWSATFAPEGKPTDDGRIFAPGSISWRDLPLSLMAQIVTDDGHDGAMVAGRIDRIYRQDNLIRAEGVFDEGEYGQEIARMVGDGVLRGLSVDLAIREYEVAPRSQVLDENGNWIYDQQPAEPEVDEEPSLLDILFGGEEEEVLFVVTDGVIGTATVCPFPAFADAEIALTASAAIWRLRLQGGFTVIEEDIPEPSDAELEGLTASAAGLAPVAPPVAWFSMEEPDELTPLTVTDDGQVYGHAAAWGTCHIGLAGVCTEPPTSPSGYTWFHLKEVVTEEGDRIPCGTITLDTNHAGLRLDAVSATAHYDDTGTAVADVVATDGELGIWIAGALRPDVEATTVRKLQGASVSGDWRGIEGNRELVALLAVNVPGFPIPRPRALVASAEGEEPQVVAMVAAGLHAGPDTPEELLDLERVKALGAQDELQQLAAQAEAA